MELTLFVILGLLATTTAGPIQEKIYTDQCAKQCTVSNKFKYEIGQTYEYTYDTEIRTAISGASKDQAGVDMSAKVYIEFLSKCEMVIRMSDVKMSEHDPETSTMKPVTSNFISELEQNPLVVSFQDGKIEDMCLSKPENEKILNIKRGILSLIQNNMDDINKDQTVTESDVSGNCETEYTSKDNGWYNKIIKKSKNLLGCTGRQGSNTAIQSIPYSSKSDVQSLPLIKSTHECQQEIVAATGHIQVAKCMEQHKFLPFSRLDSGATTHNTQTLTFVKKYSSKTKPEPVSVRVPVQFQHSGGSNEEHTRKDMEQKLMEICLNTKDGVTAETPTLFTSLVYIMKVMESKELLSVYQKINSKEICSVNNERVRKFFLDAIPMCGTTESLKLMVQLLTSEQVTGLDADMWMTSLAFLQNPSIDMLADAKPLLALKNNQEKAMLSVSSLVHTVCKSSKDCENILEVKKIISLLESKIAPSCKISDKTFETSLLALRSIGNAGYGNVAIPTLTKCFKRTENPIEIRLSAIEAFRRIPCKADKSILLSVFVDTEEDSEIRISAYKTLMECPSEYLITKIKGTLAKEEVNQVGSYVWSHLTNLMETSNPHKQAIRSVLEDETLQKEFNLDNRKFSRNYEKSLFIEKINTGAVAEGDLIWSSKSFIPRSAMANLTVDLFGNSINLFEIGGRIEGLEYFLESYFGPNGYFSEKDVKEAVDETAVDVIKADKVNRIDKRNNRVMEELRGSLYIRVFGNELRYMNFQGLDSLFSQNSFNILDMMLKLSRENNYQYTHSSMFMDSSVIVPTSSGFPLNLTVNGTATVDFKASGKMDVMKFPSMDISGTIRPSAAVVVASNMGIDALDTQVGIKMVSTLHSSSSVQGKISFSEGKVLNVKLDLPDEKQEIIRVSSSFYTVHRHSEREQKMITENRQTFNACTGKNLAEITGLELCSDLSFPNASLVENAPYFPLTGPINAGLTLHKRDKTMTGYKIEGRSTHNANENVLRLAFSTPNSKTDRTLAIDLNLNKAQGAFDASFSSPWKKADFKGTYINDNNNKGVSGKMNWDGSVRFDVKANLQCERSGPGMIYTPTVHVSTPGINPVDLRGTIKYAPWKVFETDLSLSGIYQAPVTVKSSIQNKAKMMSASASLHFSPKKIYSMDSSIQTTEYKKKIVYKSQISVRSPSQELIAFAGTFTNVYGKNIELDMVLDKIIEKPVIIKTNVLTKSFRRGRVQKVLKVDFRSQLMDIKMKNKFDNRNGKTFATDTDLTYVIRKYARDNIKLVTKITNQSSKSLTKARASMNLASKRYPAVNFKLISNVNHNKRHSEVDADIAYGPNFKDVNKQISFSMSMDRAIKSISQTSVTLNGKLLAGSDLRITTKLAHAHEPKSLDSNVMFRINKAALSSSLTFKDKSTDLKNIFGQFDLELPGGKSFVISQIVKENAANDFTSTMDAKLGKSKNTIVTSWKKASPSTLTISSDINLSSIDPIKLNAEYNLGPDQYKIGASLQKASSKYSVVATSQYDAGKSIQISADLECPSRRMLGNLEGTKSGNRFTSRADLRWNADRDDTQRVTINGKGEMSSLANVEGSFTIQYPSRTIAINLKNTAGNKYTTHIDFQWEPNKVISIDSTIGDHKKGDSREIISNVKVSSPFNILKSIDLSLDHKIDPSMYQTKIDAQWNPKESMSASLTARKPLTFRSFDIDFIGKAPSLGYKTIQSSLKHTIENGVSTIGKVTLNRQTAQVDLSLLNKGDDTMTDVKGQLDIKTSFKQLRTATVSFSHRNTGSKIDSNALLKYNKKQFGVESSLKGRSRGWELNSDGEITIILPTDKITATWGHKNTLSEMATSTEISWANKRIFLSFNGLQDLSLPTGTLSAALEIKTPFTAIQDVVFQLNHLHKPGHIDSTVKITSNGNSLVSIETKYLKENGKVASRFTASNPWYDGLLLAVMNADYESQPKTAHLELSMTPLKAIKLGATFMHNTNNDIDTSLTIYIPNKPTVELSASRQKTGSSVNSAISMKYQDGKIIRLDSVHRIGAIKQLKLKLTTPYTKEYSMEGVFQKSKNSVRANANIEAEPFIGRWSVTTSVDNSNGISGNLKVDTPYDSVPYVQFSVLSEVVDNARQSSIVAEYVPGRTVKLNSMYKLNSLKDVHISMELSTPFDSIPHASAAFRHQGDLSAFTNYGELEYKSEKMSIESKFSNNNGVMASVSLKSPYTEDISVSLNQNGNMNNFESHGEATWGKKLVVDLKHDGTLHKFRSSAKASFESSTYSTSINFNLGPKMTTEIFIETPIVNYENIHMAHTFEGTVSKFTNKAEFTKSGFGTISSNVNVDMETSVSLTISVQTPFKNFKDMKAGLKHDGSFARFATNVEFKNGLSAYSGEIKLSSSPAISFETTLTTPLTKLRFTRLAVSIEGSVENLKLHAEAQFNKEVSEVDLICNMKKKYDIDLTIRSPYTDTIKASLDHWGSWKKFQSKLNIRAGKDKIISVIKFAVQPTFNALISIKSPFKMIKNQYLSLKHAGSLNSFKCNMQYRCNGKTYNGDATFQNLKALKAELNLKGPTFRPINVAFSHDGSLSNFKSAAAMSMGKKSITADASFNTLNGIKGNMGLNTPFEGYEQMSASVSHTGNPSNFKSHGELNYNRQSGQIDIIVDVTQDISADISISTPYKAYSDITTSFKHSGSINNFNTLANFALAGKSIEGTATFQTEPAVTGSASLKSTFASIGNGDISFNHEGTLKKFKTNADLNIGNKRSFANAEIDLTKGYEGKISIDSPIMEKTDVQFKHFSTDESYNTNALFEQNNRKYSIKSDISRKPISGILTITTPHAGYETTELSVHHTGNTRDFRSSVTLDIFGGKYESEVVFTTLSDKQVALTIRSPSYEDIETSVIFQGKPTNFNMRFNYLYGSKNMMLVESALSIDGPYSGSLNVISPLMKNMKASFNHDGAINNFKSEATVTLAGKTTDVNIAVKISPEIETSFKFTSPVTKDLDIFFAHRGPLTACKSTGSVTYGGQKHIVIGGQFNFNSNLDADFTISTSDPRLNKLYAKISHEGDLSDFSCHGEILLNDKAATGDIKYSPGEGSIRMSTPYIEIIDGSYRYSPKEGSAHLSTFFTKDIKGYYKVKDELYNSESETSLSYGSRELIRLGGNMNYPNSGEISFKLPVQGYENTRLFLKRSGDIGGIATIDINGEKHTGAVEMNVSNRKMFASASVNSPILPKISSDASFIGTLLNFQTHVGLVFENNKHAIDTQFSMGKHIEGSLMIKSPVISELSANFATSRELSDLVSSVDISYGSQKIVDMRSTIKNAEIKSATIDIITSDNAVKFATSLEGQLTNFNGHMEASLNNKKSEGDISFSLRPISLSVSLKTPLTGPVSSEFSVDGSLQNFKAQGHISVNNKKNEGDISFSVNPFRANFNIKSILKDISISVSNEGNLRNFRSQSEMSIDDKKINGEIIFNIETAFEGKVTLNMPNKKPLRASFEHIQNSINIQNLISVEYGSDTIAGSDVSVSYNPLKVSISIKTPFEGYRTASALFSHNGKELNFNNHAEITIQDEITQGDMTFNFGSKLEGRLSASSPYFPTSRTGFQLSGNLANFNTEADMSFGDSTYSVHASVDSRAGVDASVTVNTPLQGYKTVTSKISHTGKYPVFNSFIQIKTGRRNLLTGSAQLDNTNGISGKVSLQSIFSPTFQANIKHTGEVSNFNTNAEIRVNGEPSTANIGFKTTPTVYGIISFASPYTKSASGSFEIKSLNKEASLRMEGIYDSKSIVGDASFEYGNTIGGQFAIKTPFPGFEETKGSLKFMKEFKGFSSSSDIKFSGKKLEAEVKSSWRNAITGSLNIKTPYDNFKLTSVDFSFDGAFPNVQTEMSVSFSGQRYFLNSAFDKTNGRLTMNTPLKGFETIRASYNCEGTLKNLQSEARLSYMTGKEIFISFENVLTDDRLNSKAKIQTPYTEDLSAELSFNGHLNDFSNSLVISAGEANSVKSTTTFKLSSTIDFETSFQTMLAGYSDEQKLSFEYEDMKASAKAKVLGSHFSFDSSLQYDIDESINGLIALQTPFANLRDVSMTFEHAGSSRRFSTKSKIQYDTNKKVEASIQYVKYGWRRLQTTLEVKTPFVGFETSKFAYRHTASVDSFESEGDISFMNKDLNGNIRASMTPLSVSVSISTPFEGFEQLGAESKLTYGSRNFNTEANVQYMTGKIIAISSTADMNSNPAIATIKMTTPFKGFENSEIMLSSSGDLKNFQTTMTVSSFFTPALRVQANMRYISLTNLDGAIVLTSQIKNFESLRLKLKTEANRGKYESKVEMSWAPTKAIIFDGLFTDNKYVMSADMSLSTPFAVLRQLNLKSETTNRGSMYSERIFGKYNGKVITDLDINANMGSKKSTILIMRSPKTMKLELEGSKDNVYEASISMSTDIDNAKNGIQINGAFDPRTNTVSLKQTSPLNAITFDGTFQLSGTKIDVVVNGNRYGYDMKMGRTNAEAKVILPTRSLKISGSQNADSTEGKFMWDADKDETKTIGFRSVMRPSKDSMKADITLMMPSIGKEVQVDSQMSLRKGRILFDGKTELTYSRDSRKKFTLMSRLEDISNSLSAKNYSFTIGITHPYTSVDVQVSTQFGKSNEKITGGLNMNYQTVKRDVKTFSVNGEIDKVRNAFSLNMDTPMKRIGINGNVQNASPYRLSLINKYDSKRPMNTVFSYDASKRSIEFQMNYDLENPNSEFHVTAKYVNSSALAAEVFHVVNRQRVSDALLALRLNSSSLLHSRIHWRPEMINDIKALSEKKMNSYERHLRHFAEAAARDINSELKQKAALIRNSFGDEIEPVVAVLSEMYETNEYRIRDITDVTLQLLDDIEKYTGIVKEKLKKDFGDGIEKCKVSLQASSDKINNAAGYVVLKTLDLYRKYADHTYNFSKPVIQSLNDKYNNYVQYMNQVDTSKIADAYSSAIYGAHDLINTQLSPVMSNRIFQQGHNAYKYWEIRENTEMVSKAVVEWIREEIEKEMSDIKATIMNIMETKVTVYDPTNGEVQMELHLPIPLKSLDVIPKVDIIPFVTKAKSFVPSMPSLSMPSSDVTTWLPPFDAMATIEGNKITTFDGVTYEMDSSCTFMLARDYVNSNFSVVLHKNGNNKTMIIVNGQTSTKIFSNGKVTINNKPVDLPAVIENVSVTSLDGHVTVNVAGHLNVDYYQDIDTYMVKLNGYYYGKTNGLFGSYDNEPSNDFMTSFGKVTSSSERFAKTWDVGTERCR